MKRAAGGPGSLVTFLNSADALLSWSWLIPLGAGEGGGYYITHSVSSIYIAPVPVIFVHVRPRRGKLHGPVCLLPMHSLGTSSGLRISIHSLFRQSKTWGVEGTSLHQFKTKSLSTRSTLHSRCSVVCVCA